MTPYDYTDQIEQFIEHLDQELQLASTGNHYNQDEGLCTIITDAMDATDITEHHDRQQVHGWAKNIFLNWEFSTGSVGYPIDPGITNVTPEQMYNHVKQTIHLDCITPQQLKLYKTRRIILAQTLCSTIHILTTILTEY